MPINFGIAIVQKRDAKMLIRSLLFKPCQEKVFSGIGINIKTHFTFKHLEKSFYDGDFHKKYNLYVQLMRIKNPTGIVFVSSPGAWSVALAALPGFFPDPIVLAKFLAGGFLVRTSAVIINDAFDKDLDVQVERTKNRPMACGKVGIVEAVCLTTVLMSIAFLILLSLRSFECTCMGIACVPMTLAYPFFKRITYFPQLVLGIVTSMGVFMGWAAVKKSIKWDIVFPLYTGAVLWAIFYDTIYGFQDMKCDVKAGIKSASIFFERKRISKIALAGMAFSIVASWLVTGVTSEQRWPFYLSLGVISSLFAHQIYILNVDNASKNFKIFRSNILVSITLFTGIVVSNLLKNKNTDEDVNLSFSLKKPN